MKSRDEFGVDERSLGTCGALLFLAPLGCAILALVVAILVAAYGCGVKPRAPVGVRAPTLGPAVETGWGTLSFDAGASSVDVSIATAYVVPYMRHWAPTLAARGLRFSVVIVPDGMLLVDGIPVQGCRTLQTGQAWLTHRAGLVHAAEWELPLLAQGQEDPLSHTWGPSGPLYPGQDPRYVKLTMEVP